MSDYELSGRQRLELALLEEDVDTSGEDTNDAAMGALVRYLRAEGITDAHIYHPRESRTFTHARFAVVLANTPLEECAHACYGRDILIAAGVIDPSTPPLPAPDHEPDDGSECHG